MGEKEVGMAGPEKIRGRISQVLVRNGTWTLAIFTSFSGDVHRVSGAFVEEDLTSGELALWGRFEEGEKGKVFRVQGVWRGVDVGLSDPTEEDVVAFASEFFKGHHFGPASAKKLVSELGDRAWAALTREPHVLAKVLGDAEKATELHGVILNTGILEATALAHLMGLGLSLAYAKRILEGLGTNAIALLDENPYMMIGVPGIRFSTADSIAVERFGVAKNDTRRLRALAEAVLVDASEEGHTSLAIRDALRKIESVGKPWEIGVSSMTILDDAVGEGVLKQDMGDVYLPGMLDAEKRAAEGLARLLLRPKRDLSVDFDDDPELSGYTEEQREAIELGVTAPVVLINGRPGTGKTTVAKEIVRIATKSGIKVTLAATTGKAAARLTESLTEGLGGTDPNQPTLFQETLAVEPARTIHSLAGNKAPGKPLPEGIVLIDEASMMDLPLLARVVSNAGKNTTLVFLGDPNQLPPVVAGNSSRDLRDSQVVPTIELQKVHRHNADSLIGLNAERILNGQLPILKGSGDKVTGCKNLKQELTNMKKRYPGKRIPSEGELKMDAFFVDAKTPDEGAIEIERVMARLKEKGYDPIRDVQVYTPMHGRLEREGRKPTHMGTKNLNIRLQNLLNPRGQVLGYKDKRGLELRVGDPVLQTRNDKERDLYNGLKGVIKEEGDDKYVVVDFGEDKNVRFTPSQVRELSLAYATTIHKGQGQEQPVTVLALHHSEHAVMLERSLLYVGHTRAKKMFICVGTEKALWMAVRNVEGSARRTRLAERTAICVEEVRRIAEAEEGEDVLRKDGKLVVPWDRIAKILPPGGGVTFEISDEEVLEALSLDDEDDDLIGQ